MEIIDQSDFDFWLDNPVTRNLVWWLEDLNDNLSELMLNPEVVLADKGQIPYAKATGMKEIIDKLLNIRLEDLQLEEEEEKDVE